MSTSLSVAEILAKLERQMEDLRQRQAHHAERQEFHRAQGEVCAQEYEAVCRSYEAFKATAGTAAELAARVAEPEPPKPEPRPAAPAVPPGLRSRVVGRIAAEYPPGETFTPSQIAAEVNRRYGKAWRKPANARLASTALRRLLAEGAVRLVRPGTPHHEAVYARA